MKRKVIRQGHNTLTVTLPSRWVKMNNLQPGGEIDVSESGNDLLISTKRSELSRKAEIRVMRPKRLVSRHIFNLYRMGVDEIRVMYDNPIITKDIYQYLPLLMGFEITSQAVDSTVLRNVLTINENEISSTMRRYLLLTKSMADEVLEAIKAGDLARLEGIMELEKAQNRLYMFLSRVINKRPDLFASPTLEYLFVQRVEDIADDYKYICKYMLERGIRKLGNDTLRHMSSVNNMLSMLYNFYYKFSVTAGNDIITGKKKMIVEGLGMLETVPKKEIRVVSILNNIIVKIYEAATPVFGMNA